MPIKDCGIEWCPLYLRYVQLKRCFLGYMKDYLLISQSLFIIPSICKSDTVGCHSVDIGYLDMGFLIRCGHIFVTHIVRKYKDDVRFLLRRDWWGFSGSVRKRIVAIRKKEVILKVKCVSWYLYFVRAGCWKPISSLIFLNKRE